MKKAVAAAAAPMEKIDVVASLREIVVVAAAAAAAAFWCECGCCFAGGTLSAEANSVQSKAVSKVTTDLMVMFLRTYDLGWGGVMAAPRRNQSVVTISLANHVSFR